MLRVGRREWARTVKEAGQPVYAVLDWGHSFTVMYIGATVTSEIEYPLPRVATLVARRYSTRAGAVTYYVYRPVRGRPLLIATLSSESGYSPQLQGEVTEREKAALEFFAGYVAARERG